MSSKETLSVLTLHDKDGNVIHQGGNLSFRYASRFRIIYKWNNVYGGSNPTIWQFPWKNTFLIADDDPALLLGHNIIAGNQYPADMGATMNSGNGYQFLRLFGTVGTIGAAAIPRVFGAVVAQANNFPGFYNASWLGNSSISQVDVPLDYTQVGVVYVHPATQGQGNGTTAIGVNYVTYSNGSLFDNSVTGPGGLGYNMVRIESGADAGYYFIEHNDYLNNRLYLRTLDNRAFNAIAAASVPLTLCAGRRAWFNEVSVIPLSVGTVDTGSSRYSPRQTDPYNRGSFILRATLDKSGSTEAAVGTEQQGSYFISARQFTHGDGGFTFLTDYGGLFTGNLQNQIANVAPPWFNFWSGGVNGMALDVPNQRLWFGYTNNSNQSGIAMWRWKTTESFREVANYLGTPSQNTYVSPAITLGAGDIIVDLETGSATGTAANWVYVTIGHATAGNGGVAIIKPDLSTLQYKYTTGVLPLLPSPKLGGCALDKSRTRVGTAADVSTGSATNIVTSASGHFTSSDLGRVIKLTGLGADSGTYKISSIGALTDFEATTVGVQTLAGGAVSFTNQSGGTFEIGDRLYLFFDNTTTNAGKMTYMESMSPGTFLQTTVSMTNGAQIPVRLPGVNDLAYGQNEMCSMDPDSGNVYWCSYDGGTQQANKYTVATNTHEYLPINNTNFLSPSGGSPSNPGTPTYFTAIKVSSKFDHLWLGTPQGHFRITKSASWAGLPGSPAALSTKRYYGTDNVSYTNPTGFPRTSGGAQQNSNAMLVRSYWEGPDGRMWCSLRQPNNATWELGLYSQANDNWTSKDTWYNANGNEQPNLLIGPYGEAISIYPSHAYGNPGSVIFGFSEVEYQWDAVNSVWFPREVVQQGVPNKSTTDTIYDPGCLTRPIHSTLQNTFMGVQLRFNRQGGATPPNNEFLGRMGQSRTTTSDGSTTNGSSTFTGSAFTAGDVGKLLRIEVPTTNTDGQTALRSATFTGTGFVVGDVGRVLRINTGGDIGNYIVASYTSATAVVLKQLSGTPFKASATTGATLSYTIDRGLDTGVYKITAYNTGSGGTQVTLTKLDGSAWTATAPGTVTSLAYSVWDLGSPGSNAGPENITVLLADGFAKDNTQDITGMTFENFQVKTRFHEYDEARKFAVSNPLAVPGALDSKVYFETYPATAPSYFPATSHHRALPATELTNGRQLLDFGVDSAKEGNAGRAQTYSSPSNINVWYGTSSFTSNITLGCSVMVDLGVDVEVGYVLLRTYGPQQPTGLMNTNDTGVGTHHVNGLIANLYKANTSGGAPVNSATIRTSASATLGIAGADVTTATVSSGDFLGAITTGSFTNGVMVIGQSTFAAPLSTFVAGDYGKVLKISGTAGADSGAYRIIAVSLDGSTVTIRNLDQTAKAWTVGASGVTYTVNDAVREEDELMVIRVSGTGNGTSGLTASAGSVTLNSSGAPFIAGDAGKLIMITGASNPANNGVFLITTFNSGSSVTYTNANGVTQANYAGTFNVYSHWLCVERLLTSTSLQIRTGPTAAVASASWQVLSPSWTPVKRLSHSTEALPPDVKANGTWISLNGGESYTTDSVKMYFDLTDLTQAQRTGRYWKWTGMPRFNGNAWNTVFWLRDVEFYDTSGKKLAQSKYTSCDQVQTNPDFFTHWLNRIDWVQAANNAMLGVSGFNGNVDLGGGNGDTLTLTTGGNKFLGFQVGPQKSDGVLALGTNIIDSASSSFPLGASVGRFIRIINGANAGNYYRVATRDVSLVTRITVTTPSGAAVSWGTAESSIQFTVHEGINVGGTYPDKFVFTSDGKELSIASINDALTTLTVTEGLQPARTNQAWEIRRPGYPSFGVTTTEPTKTARVVFPGYTYPVQTGDVAVDSRGHHVFFSEDIGNGFQRTDGSIAGGSGVITGTGFSPDDVGRLLYIVSGTATQLNVGIYEISVFTSSTSVTVKNHYTGAAVSFTADSGANSTTYKVFGDRRMYLSKYVTGLRN
jgi:hypothetical protein